MLARVGMIEFEEEHMKRVPQAFRVNKRLAERIWGRLSGPALASLKALTFNYGLSVDRGDLICLEGRWYVTHTGPLQLARRRRCRGIHVEAVDSLCDSAANRFVLKATVYPSKDSADFVGDGDAEPSNVFLLLPGLLSPFPLWFAFLAWRPQAIGVLPHLYQSALEKELDLLIRRAVLPLREFSDPRFQAGSYSDKHGNSGFVHLQITKNFAC